MQNIINRIIIRKNILRYHITRSVFFRELIQG